MHIGNARHQKICEDLGKMKNEDSRGLIRLYKGRNYVPKFQDTLHRSKHLRRQRTKHFQHRTYSQAPRHIRGSHAPMNFHCGACALRSKALFYDFFMKKTRAFNPKSGENCPYKCCFPHSLFSHLERSGSRGMRAPGASKRSFSLLSNFFQCKFYFF